MEIVKNYIKYGLFILCGLILGSLVYSAYADDSKVIEKEMEYKEAIELRSASDGRLGKLYENMNIEIEKIKDEYRPYIEDEEKVNVHANQFVCTREVELAKAKLQDNLDGVLELTPEDIKRISEKTLWKCVKEMVEVNLEADDMDILLSEACTKHADNVDTCPKIMKGVFVADSGVCTKGVGAKTLNCGNLRPGSGKYGDQDVRWTAYNNFRKYDTIRDGVFDNVAVYAQLYEGQSIDYMQRVWAMGSNTWGNTVRQYANS